MCILQFVCATMRTRFEQHNLHICPNSVAAWSGSGEDHLPGLQVAAFLPCPHMAQRALVSLPLLTRALIPSLGPQTHDFI